MWHVDSHVQTVFNHQFDRVSLYGPTNQPLESPLDDIDPGLIPVLGRQVFPARWVSCNSLGDARKHSVINRHGSKTYPNRMQGAEVC